MALFRTDFSRYCLRRRDIAGLTHYRISIDGTLVFGKRLATITPLVITSSAVWSHDSAMAATSSNPPTRQSNSVSIDDDKLLFTVFKWTATVGEMPKLKHDGGRVVLVNYPARAIK